MDHLLRYQDDPKVKISSSLYVLPSPIATRFQIHILVVLGEIGGNEEYAICEALKSGRINKPMIAWCIGTCASLFSHNVQFGHAGACANSEKQTAAAKNTALREAGAIVPSSFQGFGAAIRLQYKKMVREGLIEPRAEVEPPRVPVVRNLENTQALLLTSHPLCFTVKGLRVGPQTWPHSQACKLCQLHLRRAWRRTQIRRIVSFANHGSGLGRWRRGLAPVVPQTTPTLRHKVGDLRFANAFLVR